MPDNHGRAGPANDGSVLTSLRELGRLEAARVRDLAEAAKQQRDAERAAADAEAAAHRERARAEARRIEEEATARAERARAEDASQRAQRDAVIEEARIAAEHRARADEATRAHARALELVAAGRAGAPARPRLVALFATAAALAVAAATLTWFDSRARDAEALRAHSADAETTVIAEGRLRVAKETIARLDAELVEARASARATREIVDQARSDLDALRAACRRGNAPRSTTGRSSPSSLRNDPLGSSVCKPGDPLCGTIGPPGR